MAAAAAGAAAAGATALSPAVAIMGLQTLFSLGQAISGNSQKRKSEKAQAKATADYERKLRNIEFVNKLQALQVPTLGAELRERGIARATTGAIEATQEAGAEAVLGGVPRVVTAADAQSAEIAAQLDQMAVRRDEAVLREDQRIADQRAGIEKEIAGIDLMRAQGAGQAAADAAAQQQAGMYGVASGLGGMAVQSAAAQNPYLNQTITGTGTTTSTGSGVTQGMSLGVDAGLSPGVAGSNALTQAGIPYVRTPNLQLQGLQPTPPLSLTSASPYSGLQFQQPNFIPSSTAGVRFPSPSTAIGLQIPTTSSVTGGRLLDYTYNPYLPQR